LNNSNINVHLSVTENTIQKLHFTPYSSVNLLITNVPQHKGIVENFNY